MECSHGIRDFCSTERFRPTFVLLQTLTLDISQNQAVRDQSVCALLLADNTFRRWMAFARLTEQRLHFASGKSHGQYPRRI
jgi:hypothetical protein